MMFAVIFLGLLACTSGRLIYPDEFEILKSSMMVPSSKASPNQQPDLPESYQPSPIAAQYPTLLSSSPTFYSAYPSLGRVVTTPPPPNEYNDENALQHWNDHVYNIIVTGIAKFTLDVEREIYRTRGTSMIEQQDNIVFSPISLSVALALVLAGSAGRTFDEVSRVLGLESGVDISKHSEIAHQMFGILLTQLRSKLTNSNGLRVSLATAAYVQKGYPILPQFKAISENVYQNEVLNVDFAMNGKMAQDIINAWVLSKTMGKINSILNDVPTPDTKLILLSALYFNGEWNQHFLNGATRRRPFYIEPEKSIKVDMMYNGGEFPFYEDKQLGTKIVGLPYKGNQISMYVLLPNAKGARALRNFISKLTVNDIENLVKNLKNETCIIGLPKMKLSNSLSLKATLASLGLTSLFNSLTADLSLISQPESDATLTSENRMREMQTGPSRFNNISSRIDVNQRNNHPVRRNFVTYEDKKLGYTVEQWSTGFSIRRSRKSRESRPDAAQKPKKIEDSKNSYNVEGSEVSDAKVVNLEDNKYRFHEQRIKRQNRQIEESFLRFVEKKNFTSYGVDKLRNSSNLVNPHLYASDVLHKVEIDITETGTEAAAVTGVILERDGSQKRLLANRPFVFFIRHNPTGLILFWGTVNAPTPNYPAT